MLPTRIRMLAPLAVLMALPACADSAEPVAEDGSSAGDVLPGSISDAMLPIDSTRSEPPLIEDAPAPAGNAQAPASSAADESQVDEAPEDEAAAETE